VGLAGQREYLDGAHGGLSNLRECLGDPRKYCVAWNGTFFAWNVSFAGWYDFPIHVECDRVRWNATNSLRMRATPRGMCLFSDGMRLFFGGTSSAPRGMRQIHVE
jgi:hypothetical protein